MTVNWHVEQINTYINYTQNHSMNNNYQEMHVVYELQINLNFIFKKMLALFIWWKSVNGDSM